MLRNTFLRAIAIAPIILWGLWGAYSYHHAIQFAVRTGAHPTSLHNLGGAIAIAYQDIGVFPGRTFFNIDDGITDGGRYTDTKFELLGFAYAYRPLSGPYPLIAFVMPYWFPFALFTFFAIRVWRKTAPPNPAASFPVQVPPPNQSSDSQSTPE